MRALITGGGGFCGRHLNLYLRGQGVEVHTLGLRDLKVGEHHRVRDVRDVGALRGVLARVKPDYVFHLAGVTYAKDPTLYYRVNCEYAAALLSALRSAAMTDCPVLLVGTCAEYGMVSRRQLPISEDLPPNPYSHYGISKLAQTFEGLAAGRNGHPVVMVRPFNVIGPGMSEQLVVQSFAMQIVRIIKGEIPPVIKVGNLKTSRDFVDIDDLVRLYWVLVRTPSAYGEVVNICTGRGTLIGDILSKLIELSGVEIEVRVDHSRLKPIDVPEHYGSIRKLERIAGYVPSTPIHISLERILEDLNGRP